MCIITSADDFHKFFKIDEGISVYGNIRWELTENGILTLEGQGEMNIDFDGDDQFYGLWLHKREHIKGVVIFPGIKSIQEDIFCDHPSLTWLVLPPEFKLSTARAEYEDYFDHTPLKTIYGYAGTDSELFARIIGVSFAQFDEGVKI